MSIKVNTPESKSINVSAQNIQVVKVETPSEQIVAIPALSADASVDVKVVQGQVNKISIASPEVNKVTASATKDQIVSITPGFVGVGGGSGSSGATGATGPTGATGVGTIGEDGATGATGPTGESGVVGVISNGTTGFANVSELVLTDATLTEAGGVLTADFSGIGSSATFSQNYVLNIPDENGIKKSFGKYLNGATIPSANKTAIEVLIGAFQDAVNPAPQISITSSPDWNHPASDSTVSGSITFGIQNVGSTGSAVLEYQLSTNANIPQGDWTLVSNYNNSHVYYGASSVTFSYDTNEDWYTYNHFHFRIKVTDSLSGTTQQIANTYTTAQSFEQPTISNLSITRSNSSIPAATGTGGYAREYGDVQSTFSYKVKRNELYNPIDFSYIQLKKANAWVTITTPNSSEVLTTLANGATATKTFNINSNSITYNNSIIYDLRGEDSPHEYKVVVDSADPGSDNSLEFQDIYYYYSYQICFDTTALTSSSSDSNFQTVYDNFNGDDGGLNERKIKSGSYPSNIGQTSSYTAQSGGRYMYIFYPGTTEITDILLNGVESVVNTFTNIGSRSIENRYGVTSTYTVYRSNSFNAFDDQYLTIS